MAAAGMEYFFRSRRRSWSELGSVAVDPDKRRVDVAPRLGTLDAWERDELWETPVRVLAGENICLFRAYKGVVLAWW